jgi:O-antigen/teichoic acid export membrane protein/peptidoglycan/xylan/chitin deacetylase (PgdA/CDA1 family)
MKHRVHATLLRLASQRMRNFAAFDQVLASGSNFLTGILLVRALGLFEYGRFALAWMFVEFLASLQAAAIIQPMLNIGPKQAEADRDRYYDAVFAQQVIACMVFGPVAWASATLAGWMLSDPEFDRLALPLCAAVVAYQLQSFFRRYFFARDRPITGLVNDALRFTIQIAATSALAFAWPGSTAAVGLWIVAAGCAVSALQGLIYFGRSRWNTAVLVDVSVRHWRFSKWLLPSALMYWMTSQGFLVMAGFVLGAATIGGLKAAWSITGLVYILLLALDNFAPVQAARAVHVGGPIELRRNIARLALLTGTLVVAAMAMINIDPGYLIHLLYGDRFDGVEQVEELVRWVCAPIAVTALNTVLAIWAAAIERTRTIFMSYAAATVFTVIAAYPLTYYAGLAGVVGGLLLVETIRAAMLLVPFMRWSRATMSEESQRAAHAGQATRARGAMSWQMKQNIYRSGLRLLAASGLPRVMARHSAGQGAILSFHRLYLPKPHEFGSQSLSIAPKNFRRLVQTLQERGYDFLTMSALAERLRTGELAQRKFVCLTFDDGFVDNYNEAYAICREFDVPMTVYLVSAFVRREFPMWGLGLEKTLAANDVLEFTWEGKEIRLDACTMWHKRQAYLTVAALFVQAQPHTIKRLCAELGARYDIDFMALSDQNALTPSMIREMHASGLVEFGVHSVNHPYLTRLEGRDARWEIMQGKCDCETLLGTEIRHFAYPYGDEGSFGSREIEFCRQLGFSTAVTTQSNTIFASDRDRLLALPRLTYSGTFQDTPLLDLLLSGTLPRLRRGLRAWQMSAPVRNSLPTPLSVAASAGPEKLPG